MMTCAQLQLLPLEWQTPNNQHLPSCIHMKKKNMQWKLLCNIHQPTRFLKVKCNKVKHVRYFSNKNIILQVPVILIRLTNPALKLDQASIIQGFVV